MIKRPSIIQDTREKKPIDFKDDMDFPSVVVRKLNCGDYSLDGFEDIIVIERKANGDELLSNITTEKERLDAEFQLMGNIKHKFVVIESEISEICNPKSYYGSKFFKNPAAAPAIVLNYLTNLMVHHNIHVIFAGARSKSIIKNLLKSFYDQHAKTSNKI